MGFMYVCMCIYIYIYTHTTPRTVAYHAPLSMEFFRQECWIRLPFPTAEYLPNPGIKLGSPELQEDSLSSERHCAYSLSHVQLFATLWTVACQAPLSMGIPKARILEWVVMPSSRASSQPRDQPRSPTLQVDSLPSELPGKALCHIRHCLLMIFVVKLLCWVVVI